MTKITAHPPTVPTDRPTVEADGPPDRGPGLAPEAADLAGREADKFEPTAPATFARLMTGSPGILPGASFAGTAGTTTPPGLDGIPSAPTPGADPAADLHPGPAPGDALGSGLSAAQGSNDPVQQAAAELAVDEKTETKDEIARHYDREDELPTFEQALNEAIKPTGTEPMAVTEPPLVEIKRKDDRPAPEITGEAGGTRAPDDPLEDAGSDPLIRRFEETGGTGRALGGVESLVHPLFDPVEPLEQEHTMAPDRVPDTGDIDPPDES